MKLGERVQGILLRPRQEWQRIDTEPATAGDLYRQYVLPLAAIGPLATLIGTAVFGVSVPLVGAYRPSLGGAVAQAVVTYVLTLVATYVFALVVEALAPTFGGTRNRTQALKVAVYSSTAGWVAGIFALVPALSILGILGLYSVYLLYLGLPPLMRAPADKAVPYTVAAIVVAVVIYIVIGVVTGAILASFVF